MMAKNEIEARMRWTHGSWQAEKVGRASPPNRFSGRGEVVGPQGIPAGLSAANAAGALSAYRELRFLHGCRGVKELSVGACLYRLFISSKSMEDTEL